MDGDMESGPRASSKSHFSRETRAGTFVGWERQSCNGFKNRAFPAGSGATGNQERWFVNINTKSTELTEIFKQLALL